MQTHAGATSTAQLRWASFCCVIAAHAQARHALGGDPHRHRLQPVPCEGEVLRGARRDGRVAGRDVYMLFEG